MKLKLITATLLTLIFSYGCTVMLVPEYSETIEKQIIAGEKLNDKFYLELLSAPENERTFDSCKKKYIEIETEINSIQFQNLSRKKNDDMLSIIQTLKTKFLQYEAEHKTKGTLSDGEIKIYQVEIMSMWQPLLTAEKALKNIKK